MSEIDAVRGVYNVVHTDRSCAAHRVPVSEFCDRLESRDLPDELCVAGIESVVVADDDRADRLATAMGEAVDYLNGRRPLPAIQFVVDGKLQVSGRSLEVVIESEAHSLARFFGREPTRRGDGWYVVPYRV